MRDGAAKAALDRRRARGDNAAKALAAMAGADDCYTTCRDCGKRVGVVCEGGTWKMRGHDCGTETSR